MKGLSVRLVSLAAAAVMCISPAVSAAEYGWQESGGTKKYFMENDEYAKGVVVIDGIAYRFDPNGNYIGLFTGAARISKKLYYFDNGVSLKNGWHTVNGNTYYFYSDGSAAEGVTVIDGKTYLFTNKGVLKKDSAQFTVTADRSVITAGSRETIRFTVSTDDTSTSAVLGNISFGCLHRYENGKWYRVKAGDGYTVTDIAYILGKNEHSGNSVSSVTLSFTPDEYKLDLESGLYRVEIPIRTKNKTVTKYCEFRIAQPADIETAYDSYYIADTNTIELRINVNRTSEIYEPQLFFRNGSSGEWERIKPKSDYPENRRQVTAGSTVNTRLDLTRYNKSALKSGTYRAVIGEGLSCEFKLISPFECTAVQAETKSARSRQITITAENRTDRTVKLSGYGQLYRLNKNKWEKVKLKNGKKLETELEIAPMTKRVKSFTLTDFYSLSSLKKGKYCVQLKDENGFIKYAYFDLK